MKTARSVEIQSFGGPEVMNLVERPLASPGPGEVQLAQTAIGINFLEVSQRQGGGYPLPLPTGLGFEAAGRVDTVGEGVTDFQVGDRVAYIAAGVGAYADRRNVAADKLVRLPDSINDETAAAMMFKGLTAQYLVRKTHQVKSGELLLVHAATGGVGQILTRWATALGATVIGATTSPDKIPVAQAAGCTSVIDISQPDWPEAFLAASGGRKADVVYDSVGKDTLLKSLQCVAQFGLVVVYGAASGPAPAIEPMLLNRSGGLFLTQPSLFLHNASTAVFRANAADLFDAIEQGHVAVDIAARYPLEEIAEAHRAFESRKLAGAVVVSP